MADFKTQLKQLLAAKEYRAAIVLLENSDLPDKQTYIDRVKARMKAEAPAPKIAPPMMREKPKKQGPGCLFYGLVVVLILVVISIPVGISIKNGIDVAFLRTGLWAYCREYDKSSDCDAWRDSLWSQVEVQVRACDKQFGYPEYDHAFYACLRDAGV